MDTKSKVKAFKNEVRNYAIYKRKLDEINEKIELNEYEESGVKGIKYDTIKVSKSTDEKAIAKRRLELIEKGKKLEQERDRLKKQIDYIDNILKLMNPKLAKATLQIYAYERSYQDVVDNEKMYWTDSGLFFAIESELNKLFSE